MDFSNMTFKDYNTKAAYDNKGSSAKGLVAAYKKENPNGSAEDFFSKLAPEWNTENVKKEIALAYPKAEEKKESAPAQNVSANTNINPKDAQFLEGTTAIMDKAADDTIENQKEQGEKAHQYTKDEIMNLKSDFGNIDDKMIDKLPKFVWDAYKDGEFGEPGSKDAKQRLAHFVMNDIGTSLKGISNLFMSMSGKSPIFSGDDLQSDYSKYKKTNLEEGMKNRWKKYEAETDAAIKMAVNRGMKEEEIRDSVRQIQADRKMNTAWNIMSEKQKLFTLQVYEQAGEEIAKMSPKEKLAFFSGAFSLGDQFTPQEAATILTAGALQNYTDDEGNIDVKSAMKDAVSGTIGGVVEGVKKRGEEAKLVTGNPDDNTVTAGVGGTVKDVTLSDGTKLKSGIFMDEKEMGALQNKATELLQSYYDGKIDKAIFKKDYKTLEKYANSHKVAKARWGGIKSYDDILKQGKENELKNLFGKESGNAKKAIEFFEKNPKLLNYLSTSSDQNYTDAPKDGLKNGLKDYEKAQKMFNLLNSKGALQMVGKW